MYELVAIAAILIGVLLFSKTREGLEPTQKIKSAGPYDNPDAKEVEYRWSITPQPVKDQLLKFVNSATLGVYASLKTPEEKAKRLGSMLIEQFYENVYKSAKTPITEANIDNHIEGIKKDLNTPQGGLTPEIRNTYTSFIGSGAFKQLLKAYYIDAPSAPAAPPTPPPYKYTPAPLSEFIKIPVESMTPEFAQALELYRVNYVEYRASGKAAFKTAYEAAETWIQKYLENLRKKITQDAEYVNNFTQEYARMNPELSELQSKMKTIQKDGPQLQDKYTTVKNLDQTIPPDTTSYYVKGVIVVAVVGIIVAFSFF